MEAKRPRSLTVVFLSWLFLLALVARAIAQDTTHQTPPNYKDCYLGKGLAELYNCGKIFDMTDSGTVHLKNISTFGRYLIKLRTNETLKTVNAICSRAESHKPDMYSGSCIYNMQGNPPSWGLDRIDHWPGQELLNGLFASTASGTGVHVYVLDTEKRTVRRDYQFSVFSQGIRCSHKEFRYQDERVNKTSGSPLMRCLDGFDAVNDSFGTNDCNGHGTHVAGIVGGVKTGVAKDVFLHPVRILGCDGSGTYGAMIAGLEWVAVNLIRPAVLLLPVSTKVSITVDQAISNMINISGIIGIAAAGNFMQEACNYSPARAASVITVGSTNSLNEMSWFSNYGPCTTMFAPGESVYSAYFRNDTSYATLSGTSMACSFVAGAAALYLSRNTLASSVDVRQSLMDATESNAVSATNLKPGTTTRLLNTNSKQIFYRISPRSFHNAVENTTYAIIVSLTMKPATTVSLTPTIDSAVGYFIPENLRFPSDATWSYPQTINLVLLPFSDFLNHFATIQWAFSSKDTRFIATPESGVTVQDTDVCNKIGCGQTLDNPKLIPSLPFYYIDDTSEYRDVYSENSDGGCHIYDYAKLGMNNLSLLACNDDYCGSKSVLFNVTLLAGHVYIIMIDGYRGERGPLEIYVSDPGSPPVPTVETLPTSIPLMISSFLSRNPSNKIMCTAWSNADCQPAPTPLPIQAEFFWSPVRWGPCDKHCGGGLQQAVMKCFTGNYSSVDDWNCAQISVPTAYQVCNLVACNNYTIFEGPWGECSRSCGGGVQTRQVICMDATGNTAHPDRCGGEAEFDELQSCNVQPCNISWWETGSWNYCNVPCAGGKRFRDVFCVSNGSVVDNATCDSLLAPSTGLECNTQPCQTYAWLVGRWGDSPYGITTAKARSVLCVDGGGITVGDVFCDPDSKPRTISTCPQPSVYCDFCSYNNCSGNGVCKNGSCSCTDKWMGDYCEKPKACKGNPIGFLKDGSVDCCPYAAIDLNQRCCLVPQAIIDICCPSIRDEKGVCCLSGILDECYVCDGDGTSCATNVSILAILDDALDVTRNASVDWKGFMIKFLMKVASRLNVAAEGIVLTGVRTMNTLTGDCSTSDEIQLGCLGSVTQQLLAVFNFSVIPIPMFITGLKIQEVQRVARAGLCGNGVCERGERCNQNGQSSTTDGPCCSADCPYVPIGCPITLRGVRKNLPCSKNGLCLDASGRCDCFDGYQGEACDTCLNGYNRLPDGQCVKVPSVSVMKNLSNIFLNTTIKNTDGNEPPSKGSTSPVGTVIILILCGAVVYIFWRTYGESITTTPAAQGALQALGLRATCSQNGGVPPGGSATGGGPTQHGLPSYESSVDEAQRQARRSSLKEERREAVEERRKSRTHGLEQSSMRKSLMMAPDYVGGSGGGPGGHPNRLSGLSPKQGVTMGDSGLVRDTLTGEQNNRGQSEAAAYKDENLRNYGRNEESDQRTSAKNEDSNFSRFPIDYEDQGYNKAYPSSSATFVGCSPNIPSSSNFFSEGSNTQAPTSFFGGGSNVPPSTNFFGGVSNAPPPANFFGGGSNAPPPANFVGEGSNAPSSANVFGGGSNAPSTANFFGGGSKGPSSTNFLGGGSKGPSSTNLFGGLSNAPSSTNFFGGGRNSPSNSDIL
ncbi:hypothetical protein R1flu_006482 [Riccia fluitans]|uniref:EGF-like domain-containing protein n=1 Tax=Riccia fluitans TaxID=41844 RepID=A0ABD1YWV4_9MARC